jgi:hypothetical protein
MLDEILTLVRPWYKPTHSTYGAHLNKYSKAFIWQCRQQSADVALLHPQKSGSRWEAELTAVQRNNCACLVSAN